MLAGLRYARTILLPTETFSKVSRGSVLKPGPVVKQNGCEQGVTQVSASFFCVQSPRPARARGVPRGSGGAQAVANYLCRSRRTHSIYLCRSRRPGVHTQLPIIYVRGSFRGRIYGGWGRPQGLGLAVANIYMCTSGRLYVHTQLPIIYVGKHTITNCLCRWEPSAALYSWCIPPAVRAPGRRGWGRPWGGSGGRLAVANYLCGSGRLHVHTQLPIIYVGHTQLPIVYVRESLRGPI